jgi:dimethylargininase
VRAELSGLSCPALKAVPMSKFAITRGISATMDRCELVHLERVPLDIELLRRQHRAYEKLLVKLGCTLIELPSEDRLPDSVFVEDTAVVFDDFAIVTRPGADSRRAETRTIAPVLKTYMELHEIVAPGTLDGGDVLCVGEKVFVGRSSRSNEAAIHQLEGILGARGYALYTVGVEHCLHLKSAVTSIGDGRLLVNPTWVDVRCFDGYELIEVAVSEPAAANALLLGDTVVHASAYPRTQAILEARGVRVATVDISEISKAEGAVTCCSLIFEV